MTKQEAIELLDEAIRIKQEGVRLEEKYDNTDVQLCGFMAGYDRVHIYEGLVILAVLLEEKITTDGNEAYFMYKGYKVFQLMEDANENLA